MAARLQNEIKSLQQTVNSARLSLIDEIKVGTNFYKPIHCTYLKKCTGIVVCILCTFRYLRNQFVHTLKCFIVTKQILKEKQLFLLNKKKE